MAVDYSGFAFPKGSSRLEARKATVAAEKKAEKAGKDAVWKRDRSRCRACSKAVQRGSVDSLLTGHVCHLKGRAQGGTWDRANLYLGCPECHIALEHGGHLTVTATTTRGADGPLKVTREKTVCVTCQQPKSNHCDMDEPGLDHESTCSKMHHEFRPLQVVRRKNTK